MVGSPKGADPTTKTCYHVKGYLMGNRKKPDTSCIKLTGYALDASFAKPI